MSTTRTWTDEELMALPQDGFRRELVDGEILVMNPAGAPHGLVAVRLSARLLSHAEATGLGWIFGSSTGVRLPSGNLRCPDVAFVSRRRMPSGVAAGFLHVMPDLVVEIRSPDDSQRRLADKVGEYLDAGVALAWIIDPGARRASVHRSISDVVTIGEDGFLDGEAALPGFRCRLGDVLP